MSAVDKGIHEQVDFGSIQIRPGFGSRRMVVDDELGLACWFDTPAAAIAFAYQLRLDKAKREHQFRSPNGQPTGYSVLIQFVFRP